MRRKILLVVTLGSALLGFARSAIGQGTWSDASSDGFTPRFNFLTVVVDSIIYAIGGEDYSNGPVDAIEAFNTKTNSWSKFGTFPPLSLLETWVANGKLYFWADTSVNGGSGISALTIIDPQTNTRTSPKTFGIYYPYAQGVVSNNILYRLLNTDTIQTFDPSSNTWLLIKTVGTPIQFGIVCAMNDKIYLVGHSDSESVYDPSTNAWSTSAINGHLTSRSDYARCVLNGKLYILGGDSGGRTSPVSAVDVFDPLTKTWSVPTTNGTFRRRMDLSACAVGGKLYALGGYTPHRSLNYNQVFTPSPLAVKTETESKSRVLMQSFPNPATSRTTISFTLPAFGTATLSLTDAAGRERPLFAPAWFAAGEHELTWDASAYPSGVYLCRLIAGEESAARRVVVMK